MKSLSIVTAIILIADINLVYSANAPANTLDTIKKDGACALVCTRPETSLNPDKCMCVSDKRAMSNQGGEKSSMNDSSIHYIGSKITENGSEITIYKEENGDFIAIHPDKKPPNHYRKSKTLNEVLGFEKIEKKGDGTDHHRGMDHKPRKKVAKQTPQTPKIKSVGTAGISKKEGGTDLHAGVDHKPHKKIAKQTPNIKKESGNTVVLGGKAFRIAKKTGGADLHGGVDHKPHKKIAKQTQKIKFGGVAGLVKNTDGTDKVYATITPRGTKEKISVYKGTNGDWVTYGKDGSPVRRGGNKSLEDIFKAENHEGPISARDKYRIELDKWKRAEAARKKSGGSRRSSTTW